MKTFVIAGEGGGKGGGGSQRTPQEAPNTLRSTSKARIIDALCEGPIVGLANGLQSIFLDDTPLQDQDGSYNFQGVTVHTREGEPDQAHIAGFPAVETANDVSVEVLADTPVVRTIGNIDADAVRVTVQLPALTLQRVDNGDLLGTSVSIAIDVRPPSGSWSQRLADTIDGKTTSPYQRTYRIELNAGGPWDVRVRRLTPDSDESTLRNQTYWTTYTEVIDAKLSYPDTALVGLEVDAQQFGNQIPARSYDIKGLIIRVPDNYDPESRSYTGFWSGNFKLAWSDNPAWCFFDLATSERYGAGLDNVDKWALYQIAQYCDELVPNGYGEQEPRFTFNTVLGSREEAMTVLNTLVSAFRGMTYWGANTVMPVADMPADPVKLVTPANVIEGEFEYSGTALKARHSVALVSYNDPNDNYRLQVEVVEDAAAIEKYGWRPIDITAVACDSRGQAHRLGKWVLDSERNETETVSYRASVDHSEVRPGDLIKLSDPTTAGARLGGRIVTPGLSTLELDAVPDVISGNDWFLDVILPNGGIERREINSFNGNQVALATPLPDAPVRGAVWLLSSLSVEPRQFRVLSVTENDTGIYGITALEHDPTKYARIEQGIDLEPPSYTLLPSGPVTAPYSITAQAFKYLAGGTEHQGMTISWTPSDDPRVQRYIVEVQGPTDLRWRTVYTEPGTSVDLRDVEPGQWMIRVRGVTGTGTASPWVSLITNVAGLLLPVPPDSIDIEAGTFSITLRPRGLYPGAMWEFWRSNVALDADNIESNAANVGVATVLTDTDLRSATTYFYYVRGINAYGVSTWHPVQATTLEQFDDILDAINKDIRRPGGIVDQFEQGLAGLAETVGGYSESIEQAEKEAGDALEAALDAVRSGELNALEQDIRYSVMQTQNSLGNAVMDVEHSVRVSEEFALAQRITTLDVTFNGRAASIEEELTVLANDQLALSQTITRLDSSVGNNTASIEDTRKTIALDGIAQAINNAVTQTQNALGNAVVDVENTVRVDKEGALAQQITQVGVEFEEESASVRQEIAAVYDPETGAVAQAVTTVDVNGVKGVIGIQVAGGQAQIIGIANQFAILNPVSGELVTAFVVSDGRVIIPEAFIDRLTITKLRTADGKLAFEDGKLRADLLEVTAMVSSTQVNGRPAFAFRENGTFELNAGSSGGRTVQDGNGVRAYDSNGTLRVRLGVW